MNFGSCHTLMNSWADITKKDTSEVNCSTLATIHQPDSGIALSETGHTYSQWVDSCDKSSSFYNSAISAGAGLLVGVVAGSAGAGYTAEYAARTAIQSLRR